MTSTDGLKLKGNSITMTSAIPFTTAFVFFGLLSLMTPTSALTQLYTDGQVHVSWRVPHDRSQPDFITTTSDSEKDEVGKNTTIPPPFPLNVQFCEFGEHDLNEQIPGVIVHRVSTDTVIEYVKACQKFIYSAKAHRRLRQSRRRQKRDYDIQVIYPGTKWCGAGNIAADNNDLGSLTNVDKCCRAHDNCEDYIPNGDERGGLHNNRGYTLISCQCDEDFRQCLYNINDFNSNTIGFTYFNLLHNECFAPGTGGQLQLFDSEPYVPCFRSGFFSTIFNGRRC